MVLKVRDDLISACSGKSLCKRPAYMFFLGSYQDQTFFMRSLIVLHAISAASTGIWILKSDTIASYLADELMNAPSVHD
jgi:hypothetical protein